MNAASLINYFIQKRIIKLNKNELKNLANLVGSDVILGVNMKNTVLSSNGKLTKFKKKIGYYVLVVKPSFGCSTNLVYSKVKYFSKPKYNLPKQSLFNTKNIVNSKNDLEEFLDEMAEKYYKNADKTAERLFGKADFTVTDYMYKTVTKWPIL